VVDETRVLKRRAGTVEKGLYSSVKKRSLQGEGEGESGLDERKLSKGGEVLPASKNNTGGL